MDVLLKIFGKGKDLNALQMSSRSYSNFLYRIIADPGIRRRSFGVRTPLDNPSL
jgi:hypothetical protein